MKYFILPFHKAESLIADFVENNHIPAMLDEEPVAVDWDYYREISESGNCYVTLAANQKGLCGVAGFQVTNDPNNIKMTEAANVIFSMKEKNRHKTKEFLSETKRMLKSIGVDKVSFTLCNEKIQRFLAMNGFAKQAVVMEASL